MFTKNILSLQCLLLALPLCAAGECDGTKISERIKETQSKYVYVFPGNQAIINWTWCSAVNSTITGIVIYRVSRVNSRILLNHLLSMDLSKTVHYLKDNSRHELCSVENKTSFEEKTVFIINNVTKADSGAYSLHIRREGDSDLQSEVKVVIKTTDPTEELPLTTPWNEATKLVWTNNTDLQSDHQKRKNKHFAILVIVSTIVVSLPLGVIMTIALILCIKRKRNLKRSFEPSDQSALVKEEYV
ncbi:Hypothetical predicted protein [Paramuricea clavata]|uniref:Uncharacterized protein n=1 Tax=Paramuricea clavata TaxID=317549 RepID=A0A6S7KZV2_PARCT|nr:Hypothetical predicted protein [Paramuricea clavata]